MMDMIGRTRSNVRKPSRGSRLVCVLTELVTWRSIVWSEELERDVPKRWEVHGDLLMLPPDCFTLDVWQQFGEELWSRVATALRCSRVAKKGCIVKDSNFRSPRVQLLLGSDGWVEHVDNKVKYTYDVTRCMFSAGNISEKLRVSRLDCHGETVVDLYAGIGYFALQYLVHTGAGRVYACEWNPDALIALERALAHNNVADRCTVLPGDNRTTCPRGVADRVNLGLIPCSKAGWSTACAALKPHLGGILHIHANVTRPREGCEPTGGAQGSEGHEQRLDVIEGMDGVQGVIGNIAGERHELEGDEHDRQKEGAVIQSKLKANSDLVSEVKSDLSFAGPKLGPVVARTTAVGHKGPRPEWILYAAQTSATIARLLHELHDCAWTVQVMHIERVKSYAPRIHHIVVDLRCTPPPVQCLKL